MDIRIVQRILKEIFKVIPRVIHNIGGVDEDKQPLPNWLSRFPSGVIHLNLSVSIVGVVHHKKECFYKWVALKNIYCRN